MRLLRSPVLAPEIHGFSTRNGGVSVGRYGSLNAGGKWGDRAELVEENRRLLSIEGGFELTQLATVHQIHGARCVSSDGRSAQTLLDEDADALCGREPGRALGVYTADCVPILFSDGEGRVAAAHAGWRGTVAKVAAATVAALVDAGARPEKIRAAIGPSIGPCCFEVGEEVAERFAALAPETVLRPPGALKPRVDLWRANRLVLEESGVPPSQIDSAPQCTACHPELFFSFRRDGEKIGQMLSFIVAGPSLARR